jgi:hypothetical protein
VSPRRQSFGTGPPRNRTRGHRRTHHHSNYRTRRDQRDQRDQRDHSSSQATNVSTSSSSSYSASQPINDHPFSHMRGGMRTRRLPE